MRNNFETHVKEEYTARINKVQDYIENNLEKEFSLEELSQIANFSAYHFHRIFHAVTGETLFQYIQRNRLEKAAFLLLADRKTSITDIALKCGFSNQASFAKAFKKTFHMSASELRNSIKNCGKNQNNNTNSNMGKVFNEVICYNSIVRRKQELRGDEHVSLPYSVEVENIADMKAVYIRHTGPYKKDSALFGKLFGKLYHWTNTKKLIHPEKTKWLTLYHDTPDITSDDKLRISVCMTVDRDVETDGEIGSIFIQGGKYAVGHFEIDENQYQDAWNAMFAEWLTRSKYQPDDRLCFELYRNSDSDKEEKHIVDIYIPIKPL